MKSLPSWLKGIISVAIVLAALALTIVILSYKPVFVVLVILGVWGAVVGLSCIVYDWLFK